MKHTVNIAAGLTIIIQDDQGHPIKQIIFPFALLFFHLPALLYTAWLGVIPHASRFTHHVSLWQHDLTLMYWAVRLLIHQRRFAYV